MTTNLAITLHLVTAIPAFFLGMAVLMRPKGTPVHKMMGRIWGGLMLFTALISYFITSEGHFSWIHLLSTLTIVSIIGGLFAIRKGNVERHKRFMIGPYVGLIIAGLFATLTPGRVVYIWLFGTSG